MPTLATMSPLLLERVNLKKELEASKEKDASPTLQDFVLIELPEKTIDELEELGVCDVYFIDNKGHCVLKYELTPDGLEKKQQKEDI